MTPQRRLAIVLLLLGAAAAQFAPATPIPLPWIIGETSPFGVPGFRVLIVEESKARDQLPRDQYAILMATKAGSVRDYCESHTIKIDGKHQFRLLDLDPNADLSKIEPHWQRGVDAAKAKQLTPPYMIAGSDGRAYVGPLPKDAAATLAILKPMGGP